MMSEIMRQTQNPRHVATAHLGRRFAHLAIECSGFFDDQDTRFGCLRFSMSAVAAPENAPPMITTS